MIQVSAKSDSARQRQFINMSQGTGGGLSASLTEASLKLGARVSSIPFRYIRVKMAHISFGALLDRFGAAVGVLCLFHLRLRAVSLSRLEERKKNMEYGL